MNFLKRAAVGFFFERPARKQNVTHWRQTLVDSGEMLNAFLATKTDSEQNRRVLSHIIGIERWGQRRLQVALGAPLLDDEYDGYRPPKERTWSELQADFAETRRETAVIAGKITTLDTQIHHNMYGDLSVRGWLRYLDMHANLEAKKLK